MKFKNKLLLSLIFFIALGLRLFSLNWDQSQHLHPDERFLTMVTNDIKLPSSIGEYFDTAFSPLNPFNNPNYQFFVYGTFPLFLNKVTAIVINQDTYDGITQTGRILSAFFDAFNIILLFLLARKLIKNKFISFVPSLLYSFTSLPLQLSHFYAVDTFLCFFLLATFTAMVYGSFYLAAALFGLALACKVSAVVFVPVIGVFLLNHLLKTKKLIPFIAQTLLCLVITFFVFRVFQPYAFSSFFGLNTRFVNSLKTLKTYDNPDMFFPPAVQWLSKTKLVFPFTNLAVWGLGLPLTLGFIYLVSHFLVKFGRKTFLDSKNMPLLAALFWIIFLFIFQGLQFTYAMRYFLPIYPFIILVVSIILDRLKFSLKVVHALLAFQVLFGISFLNIYSRLHTRVEASYYIYQNLPFQSTITNEYWDDPLPLYLPGYDPNVYRGIMLPLYDPDSTAKWAELNPEINTADYMIMSSNRLWASIPQVPNRYPITSKFYRDLFDGKLNFEKMAEFNSYPGFRLSFLKKCYYLGPTNYPTSNSSNRWFSRENCAYPGIYFRDDTADESFTVYDHPKVLIFSATKNR